MKGVQVMKIVIVNGIDQKGYEKEEEFLEDLISKRTEDEIHYFKLREMNINYCQGCWDCWVKTPGQCTLQDDHEQILSVQAKADLVIYVSPLILGYMSALLKCTLDRSIPLIHPYVGMYEGEMHHISRYNHISDIGLILFPEVDTRDEEIELCKQSFNRLALNFRSHVAFTQVVFDEGGLEDVINHI